MRGSDCISAVVQVVNDLADGSNVHHDELVPQLEQLEVLHLLADIHCVLEGHDVDQFYAFQVYKQIDGDHLVDVRKYLLKINENTAITVLRLDFGIFDEVVYQPANDLKL